MQAIRICILCLPVCLMNLSAPAMEPEAVKEKKEGPTMQSSDAGKPMEIFELADLIGRRERSGRSYLPFLKVPTMSMGLYVLEANEKDSQSPHTEDEAYYVLEGRAMVRVDGEERAVAPGSILYVRAGAEHEFHTIQEKLTLLVFFSAAP